MFGWPEESESQNCACEPAPTNSSSSPCVQLWNYSKIIYVLYVCFLFFLLIFYVHDKRISFRLFFFASPHFEFSYLRPPARLIFMKFSSAGGSSKVFLVPFFLFLLINLGFLGLFGGNFVCALGLGLLMNGLRSKFCPKTT